MEQNVTLFCDLLAETIYIVPVERSWNPHIPQPMEKLKMTILLEWLGEAIPDYIESHFIRIDITKMPGNFPPIKEIIKDHLMDIAYKIRGTEFEKIFLVELSNFAFN